MSEVPPRGPNPYVGPRAFQRGERLYGRQREVLELVDLLIAERIVLLYSPSGAGKTSLLQAALLPQMEEESFVVLPPMRLSMAPPQAGAGAARAGNPFVLSLLLSLEEGLPPDEQTPLPELAGMTLAGYMDRWQDSRDGREDVLLVLDQFEEILTLEAGNRAAREELLAQVGTALRDRRRWAILAMREEFVAGLDPYLPLLPTRLATRYRLELLGLDGAQEAMQRPAADGGVTFSTEAARKLALDLAAVRVQQPDGSVAVLPGDHVEPVQLQVVCHRLWERLPTGQTEIGPDELEEVGDVDTALRDYYAASVAAAAARSGAPERAIRDWVEGQLITEHGFRSQVLQGPGQSQGLDNRAIRSLVDAHLVRAEQRRGATWYELAHDRLVEPVLADGLAWRQAHLSPLQRQAALWSEHGRPDGLLLRGGLLEQAEVWAAAHEAELAQADRAFLDECRQARAIEERERRQARRIRRLAIGASILAVAALGLALLAALQWSAARLEARRALAGQLAAQAQAALGSHPQQGLLLALEALDVEPLPAAEQALRDALLGAGGRPLVGHTGAVLRVDYSPDGRWLATASRDGSVRLWDLAGEAPRQVGELCGHEGDVTAVAFGPDGRWLATAGIDATVRLWDLQADDPAATARVFRGHGDIVWSVSFSGDGRRLATASSDATARIWDLQAADPAAEPVVLVGHEGIVYSAEFSPDGRRLATTSRDTTARIWELGGAPGAEPRVLRGHEGAVFQAAFDPGGRRLATGSEDGTVRLWDLDAGEPVVARELRGHDDTVFGVGFGPDGRWLATSSADGTARLWPLDEANPEAGARVLRGHEGDVTWVTFSPDGQWLATGSIDGTARLWPAETGDPVLDPWVLPGHEGQAWSLAFSPDGRRLASGGADRTVRLWDLEALAAGGNPGSLVHALNGGQVSAVRFDPGGRWLAAGIWDGTARLWDLDALGSDPGQNGDLAAAERILAGHGQGVSALAFDPEGRWLATGGQDGSVRLWDLAGDGPAGTAAFAWQAHEAGTNALAFNPDDPRWLASGGTDGAVRLWDLESGDPGSGGRGLEGPASPVFALAFGPDGRWLATGTRGAGDNLWLWEFDGEEPGAPRSLRGHTSNVTSVALSPEGRWLASGSADATARLWDLGPPQPGASSRVLRGHEGPVTAVAFDPAGQWLASAGSDGSIHLSRVSVDELRAVACRVAGRNLNAAEWDTYFQGESRRATCPQAAEPVAPSCQAQP